MTTSEYPRGSRATYSAEDLVAKLKEFITSQAPRTHSGSSNSRTECSIIVTGTGLDLCCPVDTAHGLEVKCTDILTILKPE